MKKILLIVEGYELGLYRGIILPCLFPCGDPWAMRPMCPMGQTGQAGSVGQTYAPKALGLMGHTRTVGTHGSHPGPGLGRPRPLCNRE